MPAAYDKTLRNNSAYCLMHISTRSAPVGLLAGRIAVSGLVAFLIVTATGLQMSLLGALLTFAGEPLFSVHKLTTSAWGLTWPPGSTAWRAFDVGPRRTAHDTLLPSSRSAPSCSTG